MLHDEDQNPPPTVEESYTTAVGSSNLRHDPDRPGAVNILICAGTSPHVLGSALMRLRTEWDASAKPIPPSTEHLRALASTYPKEKSGFVLVSKDVPIGEPPQMEEVKPMVAAQREAEGWYATELARLMQRLKSLPAVRAALVVWASDQGIEGAPHVVAAVLLWWLSNMCPVCQGVKKKVVKGTGRTSGKDCSKCKGRGEINVPHGFLGRKVLGFMNHCRTNNSKHLREMKWRHHETKA